MPALQASAEKAAMEAPAVLAALAEIFIQAGSSAPAQALLQIVTQEAV